ncbi:MAG: hypothetical protein CM15mP21_3850 [Hyphomicrobiales bacterium]|nr:MAG: hypothetical protein CM15mP21_3850 [Hyphomicrobiales bacterium]
MVTKPDPIICETTAKTVFDIHGLFTKNPETGQPFLGSVSWHEEITFFRSGIERRDPIEKQKIFLTDNRRPFNRNRGITGKGIDLERLLIAVKRKVIGEGA